MSNTPTEKLPILTNVYGKDAPAAAKAGVGARSIEEIRQATEPVAINGSAITTTAMDANPNASY